jgi:hypothetical protein
MAGSQVPLCHAHPHSQARMLLLINVHATNETEASQQSETTPPESGRGLFHLDCAGPGSGGHLGDIVAVRHSPRRGHLEKGRWRTALPVRYEVQRPATDTDYQKQGSFGTCRWHKQSHAS